VRTRHHDGAGSEAGSLGTEILEWVIVTVILTLAIFAVLQAVGSDLEQLFQTLRDALTGFF